MLQEADVVEHTALVVVRPLWHFILTPCPPPHHSLRQVESLLFRLLETWDGEESQEAMLALAELMLGMIPFVGIGYFVIPVTIKVA